MIGIRVYVFIVFSILVNSNFLSSSKLTNESGEKINNQFTKNAAMTKNNSPDVNFELSLYNEIYFTRVLTKLDIKSEFLMYLDNTTDLNDFLQNETNGIVLIESLDVLRNLQSVLYLRLKNQARERCAVIYNNSTDSLKYIVQDVSNPIFVVNSDTFLEIKKCSENYSNNSLSKNEFSITYDNTSELLPSSYLYTSLLMCMIFSTFIFIWWNVNSFFLSYKFFSGMQKLMTVLLIMKVMIIWILCLYFKISSQYNVGLEDENIFTKVYLEICLTTLNSIYRTFFYLQLIIFSQGWNIFLSNLTRIEVVKLITIYMMIYVTTCLDQVFDLLMSKVGHVKYINLTYCSFCHRKLRISLFLWW